MLIWYPDNICPAIAAAVRSAGGFAGASKASGIPEPSLRRYSKAKAPFDLSTANVEKLRRWLPTKAKLALEGFSDDRHEAALMRVLRLRLQMRRKPRVALLRTLRKEPDLKRLFAWFDLQLKKLGLPRPGDPGLRMAYKLAYARTLDSIIEADSADRIGATWAELASRKVRRGKSAPSALYKFLEAGMEREIIALKAIPWRVTDLAARRAKKERVHCFVKLLEEIVAEPVPGRAPTSSGSPGETGDSS